MNFVIVVREILCNPSPRAELGAVDCSLPVEGDSCLVSALPANKDAQFVVTRVHLSEILEGGVLWGVDPTVLGVSLDNDGDDLVDLVGEGLA